MLATTTGLLLMSAVTTAEIEARYTPAFNSCMKADDAANGITVALHDCLAAEYSRQDARLNRTYWTVLHAQPTPAAQNRLRLLQRQWIAARTRRCNAEAAEQEGGSIVPLIVDGCSAEEAVRRTIFLERYRP